MFYLTCIILSVVSITSADIFIKKNYFEEERTKKPCSAFDTVNITSGYYVKNGSIVHDGIVYAPEHIKVYDYVYRDEGQKHEVAKHYRGCRCLYHTCVRSCCWYGEKLIDGKCHLEQGRSYVPLNAEIHYENGTKESTDVYKNRNFTTTFWKPCDNGFEFPVDDYRYNFGLYEVKII